MTLITNGEMKTITRLAIAIFTAAAALMAASCSRFEYEEDLSGGVKEG